jgi:hypothetical protein
MEKEKDHDSFPDAVAAHTDGKCGGAEDQDENKTGERVVDGKIEGAGEESCSCKAEEVNADRDEDERDGVRTSMHRIAKTMEKVDQHSSTWEFLRKRDSGKKSGKKKSKDEKQGPERTKPRKGGGEGSKGGISLKAGGCPGEKEKGETEKSSNTKDAIQKDRECGTGFFVRKPAKKVEETYGIASCGSDEKEIKKKANKGEMKSAKIGEVDVLETQKEIEASSAKTNRAQRYKKCGGEPNWMSGGESVGEVRPVDLGGEEAEYGSCDADTDPRGEPA